MIPIPSETGAHIWKCYETSDEKRLFYVQSTEQTGYRYQYPRFWRLLKLPLIRRLYWWRREKIMKIRF